MSIDICITTYRSADKLKNCLNTIVERTKYVDYTCRVWCNDPDDKIKQVIHDAMYIDDILFNDRIEPVFNDDNNGSFASNNNAIAKEGEGEYILFLNDDIEPISENWLLSMKTILDTDPKVGAVGAMLLYPDKTIQHCGVFFSRHTNNLPFHMFYKKAIDNNISQFISVPRYYQAVTAACMLVRRADFEAVGGFDERFYYGFEDVALCLSLKSKLKKWSVYCPNAQLIHHEGISGTFKQHPKLQDNIKVLRDYYAGLFIDDYDMYMGNPNFMIYKYKPAEKSGEEVEIE